ncbi:hypothetical protein BJV77DRAFT_566372 [Russula vinacea]|nr:hypothetical protein BJV77DRAFT_566372 [Russula vinacea]
MHDRSHAQIVLHLLRVEASTFSLFLSMPHATARLATRPRSGPRPKRRLYQLPWRAEARTTARTLIIFLVPFPVKQHVPTFPQSAASARAFSNVASPLSRPRRPLLQSYVARREVHGHSVPHPLKAKVSSFRLLRALHAAADLATRHRRGPRLDVAFIKFVARECVPDRERSSLVPHSFESRAAHCELSPERRTCPHL